MTNVPKCQICNERPAVGSCSHCGRLICSKCTPIRTPYLAGSDYCPDCIDSKEVRENQRKEHARLNAALPRIIAAGQIIGGILSAILLSIELPTLNYQMLLLPMVAFLYGVFILAVLAGLLLWRDRQWGYRLSLAVQALQVPLLSSSFMTYWLVFGVGGWASATFGNHPGFGVNFRFGGYYGLRFTNHLAPTAIGINLVACFFLYCLWRHRKQYKKKAEKRN